jgi:hypothetical protein
VLNVKYAPGGCGCFRDWFYSERAFQCGPVPTPGYCTGDDPNTPVVTVCQHPGSDVGSFSGVAVEDKGTLLRLTSQCSAGWYRYISVWEFGVDGTLQALMDAGATNNSCVASTHRHHVYWRLDFDIDGNAGNFVDHSTNQGDPFTRVSTEQSFVDTSPVRSIWHVGKYGSTALAEVRRNVGDEAAGDDPGVVTGDFPVADGWVLAYHSGESNDTGSGCAINLSSRLNSESVDNADVVLWVRASNLHVGESGGQSHNCFMFGPTMHFTVDASTPTVTPTPDPNAPPTGTPTITRTPTITPVFSNTPTSTPTRSQTPTLTLTQTRTPASTHTRTPRPDTRTPTPTRTNTPTSPPTSTSTPVPTDVPTSTPTLGTDGPLLVGPLVEGQNQVHVYRALPPASTIDIVSQGARSQVLGTGVSDVNGEALIPVSPPLAAGQQIVAMNRTANSVGIPDIVVTGSGSTATPTGPAPTATPTALELPSSPGRPEGLIAVLTLVFLGVWATRRNRSVRQPPQR